MNNSNVYHSAGEDLVKKIHDYLDEKRLAEAFALASSNDKKELVLEKGKMFFYGLGCEPDINKAILCFEECLKRVDKKDNEFLFELIPFASQCYYEDIIINNNQKSLEKLICISEDYECKLASRYLLRYYTEIKNYTEAEKYRVKLTKNIMDDEYDIITPINRISLSSKLLFASLYYNSHDDDYLGCLIKLRDHLLLDNYSGQEEDGVDNKSVIKAQLFLVMADIFLNDDETSGVKKNIVRAKIYLDNYFEIEPDSEDSGNYRAAKNLYEQANKQSDNNDNIEVVNDQKSEKKNRSKYNTRIDNKNEDNPLYDNKTTVEQIVELQLMEKEELNKVKESDLFYYIDLKDKNALFIPEAESRYFSLVSDIFRKTSFITYRELLTNFDLYVKNAFDYILNTLDVYDKDIIVNRYGLELLMIRNLRKKIEVNTILELIIKMKIILYTIIRQLWNK